VRDKTKFYWDSEVFFFQLIVYYSIQHKWKSADIRKKIITKFHSR